MPASSSRKAVEKAPSPTRLQPESPAGQAYARDSSVCSDIGPSLTIKQRAETQQRDTQHARAEPEPLASPKTEPTTIFPSLKRKSVIRPAHLDRELYRAAMEREHISKCEPNLRVSCRSRSDAVGHLSQQGEDRSLGERLFKRLLEGPPFGEHLLGRLLGEPSLSGPLCDRHLFNRLLEPAFEEHDLGEPPPDKRLFDRPPLDDR
ncbi:hypothetical protein CBS470a_009987 [Colletotrichum nupharicola]|nr:hypothetical protein CBS470a_009987 [Colletotrichum nupharicola]